MISADDRRTFSLKIATAPAEIANFQKAQAQLAVTVALAQSLDTANGNLLSPINDKVTAYQLEFSLIDGNQRTVIIAQDIQDSAYLRLGNHFYPNQVNVTVPSLVASNNVWIHPKPFALTYGIGKNYTETYTRITNELETLNSIQDLFTTIAMSTDMANTSGLTNTPSFGPDATVIANKSALVSLVNTLVTVLNNEYSVIVTNETNPTLAAQNAAAKVDINANILPALNTWLGYADFNATGVNAGNYNSFNPNTLAPTKLHNAQLAVLQAAISNRLVFVTTRVSQLNAVLGTIVQNVSSGEITSSSGLYGQRYNFLILRLDLLNGSLNKLVSLSTATNAQASIISSIKNARDTYYSVLPTSVFLASGTGTSTVQLADVSFLSVGDQVYVTTDSQVELLRAVKSISGNVVVLNDIVPSKYTMQDNLRLYKDLT